VNKMLLHKREDSKALSPLSMALSRDRVETPSVGCSGGSPESIVLIDEQESTILMVQPPARGAEDEESKDYFSFMHAVPERNLIMSDCREETVNVFVDTKRDKMLKVNMRRKKDVMRTSDQVREHLEKLKPSRLAMLEILDSCEEVQEQNERHEEANLA